MGLAAPSEPLEFLLLVAGEVTVDMGTTSLVEQALAARRALCSPVDAATGVAWIPVEETLASACPWLDH